MDHLANNTAELHQGGKGWYVGWQGIPTLLYIVLNLDFGSFWSIRYDDVNVSVKTIKPNFYQVIINSRS